MNPSNQSAWENLVRLAEIEPDLDITRKYAEQAESEIFLRALELFHSPEASEEKEGLRAAAKRLLRVRIERLKWPAPYLDGTGTTDFDFSSSHARVTQAESTSAEASSQPRNA